jgi:tRNA (mo5U34)-methyltransferase
MHDAPAGADERLDTATLRQRIDALGPWFHNIDLGGVWTAPDHPLGDYPAAHWRHFADALPADLTGRTVLDIGCNGGFFSLACKQRGAARVLGIDYDADYLAQARFAAEALNMRDIEFRQLSVYDVGALGERFDVVLFLGVFYHLRHPLLALDLIHEHVAKDLLVFQSMLRGSSAVEPLAEDYPFSERAIFDRPGFPKLHFIERHYAGDPTNWFVPNRAAAEAMLASAGFGILRHPVDEVFVCERLAKPAWAGAVYPARTGGSPGSPTLGHGEGA